MNKRFIKPKGRIKWKMRKGALAKQRRRKAGRLFEAKHGLDHRPL